MPTSPKKRESSWAQIIRATDTPLGFYVLALLIVEAFLDIALIGGSLESAQKTLVIWSGLIMFVLVVGAVTWLVSSKPKNIVSGKDAYLQDRGEAIEPAGETLEAFSKTESGATLETFWKPGGKINKKNEKRLKQWMKENGLEGLRIMSFLIGERWELERIKAIDDLKIPKQSSAKV